MIRCDVLVVGAGPAGMAAAAAAAESGCLVVMVDDNNAAGGQIWREAAGSSSAGAPHNAEFCARMERLRRSSVHLETGARIIAQPAPHVLRIEREEGWEDVYFDKLILATGARELFLPFPGWTLPGVLGAGGLQALVKSGLPIAGKRVMLAGSGPLLLAVAASLKKKGARVLGIFEQARFSRVARFGARLAAHPGKAMEALRYRAQTIGVPYRTGSWIVRAEGDDRVRSVMMSVRGRARQIQCDYTGCGFHLVPNLELPLLLGCRVQDGFVAVNERQQTSSADVYCVGELTGIGGLDKALVEGEIAGLSAAGRPAQHLFLVRDRLARFASAMSAAFAPRAELRTLVEDSTYVCRCEDVRHGALQSLHNWREAKLHTRCGMGACQGRICGAATAFLYEWEPESVRPPLVPARIESLATTCPREE